MSVTQDRFPENSNEITTEIPVIGRYTVGNHWWTRHSPAGPGVGPRRPSRYRRGFKITTGIVTAIMSFFLAAALGATPPVWFLALAWPIVIVGWTLIIADSLHVHPAEWKLVGKAAALIAVFYTGKAVIHHIEQQHANMLADAIVDAQKRTGV